MGSTVWWHHEWKLNAGSLQPLYDCGTPMSLLWALVSPSVMWPGGERALVTVHPQHVHVSEEGARVTSRCLGPSPSSHASLLNDMGQVA